MVVVAPEPETGFWKDTEVHTGKPGLGVGSTVPDSSNHECVVGLELFDFCILVHCLDEQRSTVGASQMAQRR